MGAHHFDIAQWGLGRDRSGPVEVRQPRDEESMRGAQLIFDDGVTMTHGGPSGTTFIGTNGMIHVDRGRILSVPDSILAEPLGEGDVHLPRHANHRTNWLECIRSREDPICDVEVGARSITLCHLLNLAYWNRASFGWDPLRWKLSGGDATWLDYERRAGYELPSL